MVKTDTKNENKKIKMAKITIKKKMTTRDFLNLVYFFETGEREADLSGMDPSALCKEEIRVMRLTPQQKEKMDDFLSGIPFGLSFKALADSIPRVNNSGQVLASPTPANVVAASKKTEIQAQSKPIKSVDDVDIKGFLDMVEAGEMNDEGVFIMLREMYGEQGSDILSRPVHPDIKNSRAAYRECPDIYNLFVTAFNIVAPRIKQIMTEPEPSKQETLDRYKNHVLYAKQKCGSKGVQNRVFSCDGVESVTDNKIIFDSELDWVVEYDNEQQMKDDLLFLASYNKFELDREVTIFGKNTTCLKIIEQIYKKNPNGMADSGPFFASAKEAFLAGALDI